MARKRGNMELHWERHGSECRLRPVAGETNIIVRPEGAVWNIYVNDHPLMPGNFNNEEGAKRVAWQFVLAKGPAIYSTRSRFKLRA